MRKTVQNFSQNKAPVNQMPPDIVVQRKCNCGGDSKLNGSCANCEKEKLTGVQPKLRISAANDVYEQEADRVANQVMRSTRPSTVSPAPIKISRFSDSEVVGSKSSPASVERLLSGSGRQLETSVRQNMEQGFGHDFSKVRIHTGSAAANSAKDINAHAYTAGHNIVFDKGRYTPGTRVGRHLLAHELTHVVQQSTVIPQKGKKSKLHASPQRISRQPSGAGEILDDAQDLAEKFAIAKLNSLAAKPGPKALFSHPPCPKNFCQPFANKTMAQVDLLWAGPLILAGIAKKVNSRVVPLWFTYLNGGAVPSNMSKTFGADFTKSSTTVSTTSFLIGELKKDIKANHISIMGGKSTKKVDFTPGLSSALKAIDKPGGSNVMNFSLPSDIAGNIAGGVGKDQLTHKIGAKPSPFDDLRSAKIEATLTKTKGGLTIIPKINFSIKDTIDLCPGNCGASTEQIATIPLSRFEATGLVGDVPFTIDFPAPVASLAPFFVPIKAPPVLKPISGSVTASALRIRTGPNTGSKIVGSYPNGTSITILCETSGESIDGNSTWNKTKLGFVSDRYVTRIGLNRPPSC